MLNRLHRKEKVWFDILQTSNDIRKRSSCEEEKIDIVFPEQAHLKLLNHIEYEAVWNGIYKTELIKNIFSQLEKRMRMFFGSIRQSTNVIK